MSKNKAYILLVGLIVLVYFAVRWVYTLNDSTFFYFIVTTLLWHIYYDQKEK